MMTYDQATNPPILPSRLLMQPPDDVWGNYDTVEQSWLAIWHWPSGTKLTAAPGAAAFYVLPDVNAEAEAALGQLGINAADAPLALFSGLVAEQLKGHRDNEDVLAAAWDMLKQAYANAVSGNFQGLYTQTANAHALDIPIMKLDERNLTLHPSPELFPAALAIVRDAYINGTSIANALATIRDTMAPGSTRIRNLIKVHEANEVIASHALAPNSVALKQYAVTQSMSVDEARRYLLGQAGADANGKNMTNINPNLGSFLINTVLQPSGPKGAWGASKPKPKLSLLQSMTPGLFQSGALPSLGGAKKASGTFAPVDTTGPDAPSSFYHPVILAGVGAGAGALVASGHRLIGAGVGVVGGVLGSLAIAHFINSRHFVATDPTPPKDPTA